MKLPYCTRWILAAFIVGPLLVAGAADWPQYMGPDRTGVSPETGLARTWPDGGPKVLWSFPLSEGYGGPAIRDGEVYVLDRVGLDQPDEAKDVLRCLSLDSGAELWRFENDAPGETSHNGSRTPPTVTETHVYAVGLTGWLYAIDRETHQATWKRPLEANFPPAGKLTWGYAQSPTVDGDTLIVAPQSDGAFVVAFNRNTGEVLWKDARDGAPGYSSPRVTTLCGVKQVVMISASRRGAVYGIDFATGKPLWAFDDWTCRIPIPFVTPISGNRLFVTGEYGAGSVMLEIKESGGTFSAEERFNLEDVESQIHQPILYQDHLYLNSNGNSRNDGMLCMTLDGKVLWRTSDNRDLPRFERGSLILADGMILNLDGKEGTLHLVDPAPEGYKELARAKLLDGSKIWSPMALSDGKLVLRSQSEMKCVALRNP